MPYRKALLIAPLLLGLCLIGTACPKKPPEPVAPEPPQAAQPAPPQPPPREEPVEVVEDFQPEKPVVSEIVAPSIAELNASGVLGTVYFEFDRYDLGDEARRQLKANADWLTDHAKFNVLIEGHCDERGTIEYNLALGERRAKAVRDYLSTLGVGLSRMRIISYGEERPVDSGRNEAAWSRNRRAAFVIER